MNKIAFVFPGQGSQSVGMLDALSDYAAVTDCLKTANDILGTDLLQMINQGPAETLNQTQWTQPALLATSVGIFRSLEAHNRATAEVMAGHSLGEYSALVCAGALAFETAVELVHKRGLYMQEAVPAGTGSMAAVLGLEAGVIESICEQTDGMVSPANYNAPGQIVIAGEAEAVAAASALCIDAGAKKVMPLAVSVPSHCELMKPAAARLAEDLNQVQLQQPSVPVLHNVDVTVQTDAEQIKQRLQQQLYAPVRWTQTMGELQNLNIDTVAECGPGKVLSGLFKRFDRSLNVVPLLNAKGMDKFLGN